MEIPVEQVEDPGDVVIAKYKKKIKNPMTAIRAHCVECMGGQVKSVADCTSPGCALYPFRMGKNVMHGKFGVANPKAKRLVNGTRNKKAKKNIA